MPPTSSASPSRPARPRDTVTRNLLALALLGAGFSACDPASNAAPPSPSSFWTLAIHQDGVADKTLVVCADEPLLLAFMRSLPEVDGSPCLLDDQQLVLMEVCTHGSDQYAIHSQIDGTGADDFTTGMVISSLSGAPRRFERRLHFRRNADRCPAAWDIGEAGALGERVVQNVVSGKVRILPQTLGF
jgi:hypothetical protein